MRAANTQQWMERLRAGLAHPRLPDAVSLALVVMLGWQLAALTWAALPTPANADMPPASAEEPATSGEATSRETPTARLARLHLFGEPAPEDDGDSGPEHATDAPETQLNLTLKGVYAPGEEGGLAIIVTGGSPEKVYAVGDTIAGSARITGIFSDRVVLRRGGQAETLRMDLAKVPSGQEGQAPERSASSGDGGGIVERARALRERIRQNPVELGRMVRFEPYMEDGELVGFRIQPRSDEAAVLEDAGIRPDDIVTRVNGIPLSDREQANRALRELQDASTINVTILRDGRSERLSIPIGDAG